MSVAGVEVSLQFASEGISLDSVGLALDSERPGSARAVDLEPGCPHNLAVMNDRCDPIAIHISLHMINLYRFFAVGSCLYQNDQTKSEEENQHSQSHVDEPGGQVRALGPQPVVQRIGPIADLLGREKHESDCTSDRRVTNDLPLFLRRHGASFD